MADPVSKKDFFISYNKADKAWAEWIAWQLEEAGHTVTIQAWDFGPAGNFVIEMNRAIQECGRVLAVLSPTYLTSLYTLPEWAAYFADDPTSAKRSIVPVRVRECELKGLLAPIVYVDLLNKPEDEARTLLLDGVKIGRRKPSTAPAFPGTPSRAVASQPRFPGALPTIWNVPHLRNPNFTEPGFRLSELRAALQSGQPAVLTQALAGLGGVGKTQLAVEYAWRHHADYNLVWWLPAEQPETLAAEFAALAGPLGLPAQNDAKQSAAVAAVRAALRQRLGWLLIFDNANSPHEIRPYLPGTGGHVLITSRHAAWGGTAQAVKVETWTPKTAVEFLLKRTTQTDAVAARELAHELGHLPLALEQAAAYVEAAGITFVEYLRLFREHQLELLQRGQPDPDYHATVATTWEISFQRLQSESPAGSVLLNLCAFFAPDDIPRTVIVAGVEHLPTPLREAVKNDLAFHDAVVAIRRYSLVEVGSDASLSIHRLVQAVIRERLKEAGRKLWAEAAVRVINEAFPFNSDDVRTWKECARLLPHVVATIDHAEVLEAAPGTVVRLMNQMGLYLQGRAQYSATQATCERGLRLGIKVFGPGHPNVADMVNNLGLALRALGKLNSAKTAFESALQHGEKVLGLEHPDVAIRLNNLGNVRQDLGDLAGAKAAYERAIRINEKVFGPYHPNVARDINNLGSVHLDLGNLSEAKEAFERALHIDEKAYGPEHPSVARDVNNIGNVLRSLGDLLGAKASYERALGIGDKVYDSEHPDAAIWITNLGSVQQALGDLPSARGAFERALGIFRRFLGDDHPNTKRALRNLRALES